MSRPNIQINQPNLVAFLLFIFLSFALYWRSIPYSFHYDDYAKIVLNPSTNDLSLAIRSIKNPNQTGNSVLNHQIYRPWFVITTALQNKISGGKPSGFRAFNILIHGLNAALVALLAAGLFNLGGGAGLICGLFFLLHPTQVESVVWVSELSNTMATFFVLGSIAVWDRSRKGDPWWFGLIPLLFVLGLGFRETAITIPIALFVLDQKKPTEFLKISLKLILITLGYLALRTHVLGKVTHLNPGEFSWITYGWSILINWGMSIKYLLFPLTSSINLRPWTMPTANVGILIFTLMIFVGIALLTTWHALVKRNRWAVCLLLMWIFWLPTSNIIPIRSIFSERFLYLILVPFSWMVGMAYQKYGMKIRSLVILALVGLAVVTIRLIPAWTNNKTLWEHAIKVEPDYWSNWVYLAEWEKTSRVLAELEGRAAPEGWRERAEKDYIQALNCGLPPTDGARIFLRLAEINWEQGKPTEAEQHSQRALALNPNLKNEYEDLRRKYVH